MVTKSIGKKDFTRYFIALLRITLGWVFLWAFLDKTFGLGFSTAPEKAWLAGSSPTYGFLAMATTGPFADLFKGLAGSAVVDWLFMLGLLGIGTALLLGVAMRIASYAGALLVFLMWLAVLPPAHNPLIDEHIVYLFALLLLGSAQAGHTLGLGKLWGKTKLVQKWPILG